MENERFNKQNEILSKAKESIFKFQQQFNNYINNNKNESEININDDDIMTFKPKSNDNYDTNPEISINKNEEENKTTNYFLNKKINKISFSNENDFINNDNENINDNNKNGNYLFENKLFEKNDEKRFKNIIEENEVLKNEINKLIDENRILNTNLNKELSRNGKNEKFSKIKTEKSMDNLLKNNEIELILQKNKELNKTVKELNNRNRIQKKRNQDIEQILKEKNNYITQIEQKLKDINTNNDKNNMYKTKYNQLLARFDIINKELTQLKKIKSINEDITNENKKSKEEQKNISKNNKDINININENNKDKNIDYQKKYKKLLDENKSLNEKVEKLKKEKIILKNTKYNNKFAISNSPKKDNDKNSNKIINDLQFENNSLKDICSEVQNKNKELKSNITELQNKNEMFKKKYLEDIEKLQKEIIDFKQKELNEKKELKNQIKLLTENPLNKSKNPNIEIIDLRNQVKELIQYKNKCNILEEKNSQLKLELRKNKQIQEKSKLIDNNKDIFKISNKQTLFYKMSMPNPNFHKKIDNNLIQNGIGEGNEKYIDLNKKIGELIKKNEDLSKENDKINKKKNELIQQVNNLNDLIDLNNKDLVNKILELEKVIEVLNKELNIERDKNYFLENKIIKLEKNINRQIDEVSEREEFSIKKDYQKSPFENNNNNNKEVALFSINEEQNELIENYKNQIILLKAESNSLVNTINNLKNEIRIYQLKSKPDKKSKEKISTKDDEDLINNITNEMNKWKKEYYNLTKINDALKEKLSKYEKNSGVDEEIKFLKDSLYKKDKLLMDLTLQIKEYQSKSDDIILGKTNKNMEKQIEILLKEVKGIRKRLLNIVTLNDRINNFDDFISNIEIVQKSENKIKDKDVKKALEKLKLFLDEYKLCNDMAYNEFLVKLYSV